MKTLGVLIGVALVIFIGPLIGVCVGAFVGWVVDQFFHDAVYNVLNACGIDTTRFALWEFGATLGFVSSFFRNVNNKG